MLNVELAGDDGDDSWNWNEHWKWLDEEWNWGTNRIIGRRG